jgi:small neutral amino acid transporter SnatA (MarC family)
MIIAFTLAITCSLLILMKFAHDHLRYKHAKYIDRYVDIVGRLSALLIGTIAIDMIITGIVGVIRDIPKVKM